MPTDRMGPPPGVSPPMRMTASWSGSNDPTAYKSVTRKCAPNGELPSDPQAPASPKLCKKPLSQFIIAPRAQASRRCETQATLGGKPSSFSYRFGPLTPCARSANLIAGDGTKNGLSAPNKEPGTNQNDYLTEKAPYKSSELLYGNRLSSGTCLEGPEMVRLCLAEGGPRLAALLHFPFQHAVT